MPVSVKVFDRSGRVVHQGTSDDRDYNPPRAAARYDAYESEDVRSLRAQVREYESFVEGIKKEPMLVATVVEIRGDRMSLSFGPGNAVDVQKVKEALVGDRVLTTRNTMAAVEIIRGAVPSGTIVTVKAFDDEHGMIEAEHLSELKAYRTPFEHQKGERVILDASMTFVIGTLGMPPAQFGFAPKISVGWDDVGGQEEAKAALREAIELPHSHPELFALYGKQHARGILLEGPSGCLTGDTIINITRKQNGRGHKGTRLDALFYRFNDRHAEGAKLGLYHDDAKRWDQSYATKAHCYLEDKQYVGTNEIEGVVFSGVKLVYRLTTDHGAEIKATPDHEFLTVNGYVRLDQLKPGDVLLAHREGVLVENNSTGRKGNKPLRQINNVGNHPYARHRTVNGLDYSSHPLHRLVVEADMNGMRLEEFLWLLHGDTSKLEFLPEGSEVHHKDEDRDNNTRENLEVLSKADHAKHHLDERGGLIAKYRYEPRLQKVAKIERVGKMPTYDIQMKAPNHNFVANGLIVHNCGKTLLSKAAATSIARAHGHEATSGFIYVKGPELLHGLIGRSEESVRKLFASAREHKAAHGYPALVFLDECDALLGGRDKNQNVSLNATIVPQFLAEMDGLEDHAAIFLLATNRPDMLDAAVTRDGRVDRKVRVSRPSRTDAAKIFEIHLRSRPVAEDFVDLAVGEIYSDARVVREVGDGIALRLRDFASGALIAGVVERAATLAILRDIERGSKAAGGITCTDVIVAIDEAERGLLHTSHSEVMKEILDEAEHSRLARS